MAFPHSLQDFDEKKCEKNLFSPILLLHSMAKSAVKSVFSLHSLPVISPPKFPFSSDSAGFGAKTAFCEAFPSSPHWIFSPEISFCTEKISLTGYFCLQFVPNTTFADEEKEESRRYSLPPPLRSKNTSRLYLKTSPLFATSSLVSLKTSLLHTNSHSTLRAGHAPARIYALALSANLPFLPSPFTSPCNKL